MAGIFGNKFVRALPILAALFFGLAAGVGAYTFLYAKGASYMTNNAAACANCHVMNDHYAGWLKSSHRSVAACNDCHTPHTPVRKYMVKASNGFWHSFAFTTGRFHEPIQIKSSNRKVTEEACRDCHKEIVTAIETHQGQGDISCIRCHSSVGHLTR